MLLKRNNEENPPGTHYLEEPDYKYIIVIPTENKIKRIVAYLFLYSFNYA